MGYILRQLLYCHSTYSASFVILLYFLRTNQCLTMSFTTNLILSLLHLCDICYTSAPFPLKPASSREFLRQHLYFFDMYQQFLNVYFATEVILPLHFRSIPAQLHRSASGVVGILRQDLYRDRHSATFLILSDGCILRQKLYFTTSRNLQDYTTFLILLVSCFTTFVVLSRKNLHHIGLPGI